MAAKTIDHPSGPSSGKRQEDKKDREFREKLAEEHDEYVQTNRKLQKRYSNWIPWIVGGYIIWNLIITFAAIPLILLCPVFKDTAQVPLLTAMIASTTVFTLSLLLPILSGTYGNNREKRGLSSPAIDAARSGANISGS